MEQELIIVRKKFVISTQQLKHFQLLLTLPYCPRTKQLILSPCLDQIFSKINNVSYKTNLYVYCRLNSWPYQSLIGQHPSQQQITINLQQQFDGYPIMVRFQPFQRKRRRERKIYEVIGLVSRWQRIYQNTHYSRDQAAQKLGVSRKTMYDYNRLIKMGQQKKFDYAGNYNNGIGTLRSFLKNPIQETIQQIIISSSDDDIIPWQAQSSQQQELNYDQMQNQIIQASKVDDDQAYLLVQQQLNINHEQ